MTPRIRVYVPDFRALVFSEMEKTGDLVRICVPAAGILRDAPAVKLDRDMGKTELLRRHDFSQCARSEPVASGVLGDTDYGAYRRTAHRGGPCEVAAE